MEHIHFMYLACRLIPLQRTPELAKADTEVVRGAAALGMVIAFLVICTLVEISLSYFEVPPPPFESPAGTVPQQRV